MSLSRRISISVFLFAAVCGFLNSSATGKPGKLSLTKNGRSDYQVVIRSEASEVENFAAAELVKFVGEISGAKLSIVTDEVKVGEYEILLGRNRHLEELGVDIDFEKLGKEGFAVRTKGKNIIIAGNSGRGTMYGVYTFLENYLGCMKGVRVCFIYLVDYLGDLED